MPCTEANRIPLLSVSRAREEVVLEESLVKITCFLVSVSIFNLKTCPGRKFQLQKRVAYSIPLVRVRSPSVRLKVKAAEAERKFFVNSREHTFSRVGAILAGEATGLERDPVTVEDRIELVERNARRSSGADKK